MSQISNQTIINILNKIMLPDKNISIVEAGLIYSIINKDQSLTIIISINDSDQSSTSAIIKDCMNALESLKIKKIDIITTKERKQPLNSKKVIEKYRIPNVGKIVIIASGKGGVGKSTLTINLAATALMKNLRIGIIDADINGPSIPHMMGDTDKPLIKNNIIIPNKKFGIKFLSMGNLINEDSATIWRSPMYSKILNQIIAQTDWGNLDMIFIDVPPGTGDIHLSLVERYNIDGIVMISAPQKLALLDVKKSINMYRKLNLPILGIVENMLFSKIIAGKKQCKSLVEGFSNQENLDFLGTIPFKDEILKLGEDSLSEEYIYFISYVYKDILNKLLNKL